MPSKKKIVLVGSLPPPYHGSNVYFEGLLHSRIKDKYEIFHVDISDHRGLENLTRLDITNVELAMKGIFDLKKALHKSKPDLVYIPVASNFLPFLRDGLLILTASYFSKAKIIIHLHEGEYFRKDFYDKSNVFTKKFIDLALSKVDTAIVYTPKLETIFTGLVKKVVSFLNGKDVDAPKDFHRTNDGILNIGYIGNLFESKGILSFLKSAALISSSCPDIRFRIAGTWGADKVKVKSESEHIISENDLEDKVEFLGTLTEQELKEFYMSIDVMIFPTKYPYEGCPLIIIDAMGFGIPVISSKGIGAIPDMITDGTDGILVDPDNPNEIADEAISLINDPGKRTEMGKAGRMKYEKAFTKDTNIANIIMTFEDAMSE
jgi:glycosyltransferase involved in cell wall biosynthesis